VFQVFGLIGLAGLLAGVWNLAEVWRDSAASWWAKATSVFVMAALCLVSILAIHLHLLSATLSY
jgi:hypothetical protein